MYLIQRREWSGNSLHSVGKEEEGNTPSPGGSDPRRTGVREQAATERTSASNPAQSWQATTRETSHQMVRKH